jgi:hypothetical protein
MHARDNPEIKEVMDFLGPTPGTMISTEQFSGLICRIHDYALEPERRPMCCDV